MAFIPSVILPTNVDAASKRVANIALLGLGAVGLFISWLSTASASSDFGLTSPFADIDRKKVAKRREEVRLKAKEKVEQKSAWISPLNYIGALVSGNGLNAEKGAEEVSTWDPRLQLFGRAAEIVAGNKVIKGANKVGLEARAALGNKSARNTLVAKAFDKASRGKYNFLPYYNLDLFATVTDRPYVYDGIDYKTPIKGRWRSIRYDVKGIEDPQEFILPELLNGEIEYPHKQSYYILEYVSGPLDTYFDNIWYKFKGIGLAVGGDKFSFVFLNDLRNNIYRYLRVSEPKVQSLVGEYLRTGDLRPIIKYYKIANPLEREQLSSLAKLINFVNSEIPYRYYSNPIDAYNVIKNTLEVKRMHPEDLLELKRARGYSGLLDNDRPIIMSNNNIFTIHHEGNHSFQHRFGQPLAILKLIERALPLNGKLNATGKNLTGNLKASYEFGEYKNVERGSTLASVRAHIMIDYFKNYKIMPTFELLQQIIYKLTNELLLNHLKNDVYGKQYAKCIETMKDYNFNDLREALILGYKNGGKL